MSDGCNNIDMLAFIRWGKPPFVCTALFKGQNVVFMSLKFLGSHKGFAALLCFVFQLYNVCCSCSCFEIQSSNNNELNHESRRLL